MNSQQLDSVLERAQTYSTFADHQRHLGTSRHLQLLVEAAQTLLVAGEVSAVTVFDDVTGQRTEVDREGHWETIRSRVQGVGQEEKSGPGRPKLGVVCREVSLLPRHWEWLAAQSGGASAALRRLVEEARKGCRAQEAARRSRDAVARAMTVLGGDRPGFEEALRLLYAGEFQQIGGLLREWPEDIQAHVTRLVDIAAQLAALAHQEQAQE